MITHSYVFLPDIIGGSGDLQSSIPAEARILLDLLDGIEVFLELSRGLVMNAQLYQGTHFGKVIAGRTGSLCDTPALHLTSFQCNGAGSPCNRLEAHI